MTKLHRAGVRTKCGNAETATHEAHGKLFIIIAAVLIIATIVNTSAAQAARGGFSEVQIPAEVIFKQSADAVFMLETFDAEGESIRTGSGFFISADGFAITNLHVIQNAASANITLYNGDVYPVKGVNASSEEYNLAIISIDSDEDGWDYLTFADSDLIVTGNSVYVIGSPLGFINTMSAGIISNTKRDIEGEILIQFTSPISFGSGGSPLLNARGQVLGVTSSSFSYGQNLNLAVPINFAKSLKPGECVTLKSLLKDDEQN